MAAMVDVFVASEKSGDVNVQGCYMHCRVTFELPVKAPGCENRVGVKAFGSIQLERAHDNEQHILLVGIALVKLQRRSGDKFCKTKLWDDAREWRLPEIFAPFPCTRVTPEML